MFDELTKEDLEKEKLRLEIAAIDRPIWKKPTFWAAIVPILVMLYGAGQLAITGYFDNQRTLIEIKTEELADREKGVRKEVQMRQDELENKEREVEEASVELADKEQQTEQARRDYEKKKVEFEADIARLQKKQEAEREKLRQIGALGPVREAIVAMYESERPWNQFRSRPMLQLIDQLKRKDTYRDARTALVVKEFERADLEPEYRVTFAYILYKALSETRWRDEVLKLLAAVIREGSVDAAYMESRANVLVLVSSADWQKEDEEPFAELMLDYLKGERIASDLNIVVVDALGSFYRIEQHLLNQDGFLSAVQIALNFLSDGELVEEYGAHRLMLFLRRFAPQALVSYAAHYFSQVEEPVPEVEAELFNAVIELKRFTLETGQIPESIDADQWRDWYVDNKAVIDLWMEPDLGSFRSDSALLDRELKRWKQIDP